MAIASLNHNIFDSVFFFEEEMNRVLNPYEQMLIMPWEIEFVKDMIKFHYKDLLDLSKIEQIRYNFICENDVYVENSQSSVKEKSLMKVYFVRGIPISEEIILNFYPSRFTPILQFPADFPKYGTIIILEDIFNFFFNNKIYVYFNEKGQISPLKDEEEHLFQAQQRVIDTFVEWVEQLAYIFGFAPIGRYRSKPILSFKSTTTNSYMNKISPIYSIYHLCILASLRRYLRAHNPLFGTSEFDDNFIIPLLASDSHSHTAILPIDYSPYWTEPALVLPLIKSLLHILDLLESARFRNLNLTKRYMTLLNEFDNLPEDEIYTDKQGLEEAIQNVKRKGEEDAKKYWKENGFPTSTNNGTKTESGTDN